MKNTHLLKLSLLSLMVVITACSSAEIEPENNQQASQTMQSATIEDKQLTACRDPRPEQCTQVYQPVCAVRDTGVRCVTTPCPSSEYVTYPNSCEACADPRVSSWKPGACDDENQAL